MKFTQKQVDEGVKELLATLLMTAATGAGLKYSIDQFKASQEPIETKIQAAEKAKEVSKDLQFDKEMDKILKDLKSKEITADVKRSAPVLVKPKKRYDLSPSRNNDVSIEEYSSYIIPSEIYGNDIRSPENKKFLKPYQDDVGLWTIGIGRLIGKGSNSDKEKFIAQYGSNISINQLLKMFNDDVQKHVRIASNKFGDQWNEFSPDLKKALVDISFRGDLLNPKSKEDFNFVKQIKNRNFKSAAKIYLDHKEYKKRMLENGKNDGVIKRMNRNARMIANETPKVDIAKN